MLSSLLWGCYMLVIGIALGPLTGGDPLLCVLAGTGMALATTGLFWVANRALAVRRRAARPAEPVLADR
ncbi:hypothetical protein [Pseudonocardia sp. HH130630-07]|uniref:hypothetical protein n=1 Tax=Pseudonocardia sp. HH130630-07 TaxID=1690815 RepID=UPI000814E6DD|nr:hypothetical protein [Pseudonocardia sp. HH130630-07]ANY05495.1 hypothetical protein AFB00_03325 [Pseudonocardia sp. HH130630-07]